MAWPRGVRRKRAREKACVPATRTLRRIVLKNPNFPLPITIGEAADARQNFGSRRGQ